MLGERILLENIFYTVDVEFQDLTEKKFGTYYEMPSNYSISKKNTDVFSVGLFFGKKTRVPVGLVNSLKLGDDLFDKVKPLLQKYVAMGLRAVRPISKEIIKVDNSTCTLRAEVICVFCLSNDTEEEVLQKRIAIQHEPRGKRFHWNLGNFQKHLIRHSKSSDKKTADLQFEIDSSDALVRLDSPIGSTESGIEMIPENTIDSTSTDITLGDIGCDLQRFMNKFVNKI